MIKRTCGNCWYWNPDKPEKKECKACGIDREKFYPRNLTCSICDASMIMYQYEYAICPDCGTRIDPFFYKVTDGDAVRDEFEKQLPAMRNGSTSKGVMHSKSTKGGSKSSKGRSKQEKMSRKTPKQMHDILASQPNKIVLKKAEKA